MARGADRLRILFTNHQLGETGGTEANVRDWAIGMQRRGHRPIVYAPVLGRTAETLTERSIPVVDDLAAVAEPPDVIHGTHAPTILEAIVRFPRTPVVQTCQSVGYTMSIPLSLPQIRRHLAVDEATRDYLVVELGIPADDVEIVGNAVDLRRIPARARPLPATPRRALVFTKTQSQVPLVEEACRRAGIAVDTLGRGVGRVVADPEPRLVGYDLVFATARSAMEAIVAGAATIVVDGRGLAGMATRGNFPHFRRHNFGLRCLVHEVALDAITREIARYDVAEAAAVTAMARVELDAERQLDRLEVIHRTVVDAFVCEEPAEARLLAALVPVLHTWLPRFPGTAWPWQFEKAAMLERIKQLETALARERAETVAATRPAVTSKRRTFARRILAALAGRFEAAG